MPTKMDPRIAALIQPRFGVTTRPTRADSPQKGCSWEQSLDQLLAISDVEGVATMDFNQPDADSSEEPNRECSHTSPRGA
jgi:hypothetical protein